MASLTVQKKVRVSVPGFAAQTLTPGTVVQDTSPFYNVLTQDPWASNLGQFTPLDDFPAVEAWYEARYVNGFGGALPANDGDVIASWSDLSGNTRDLTFGVGGQQPIWRNRGMNICPPLSDWTLAGGATYALSNGRISLPPGATATILFPIPTYAWDVNEAMNAVRFVVEHSCTEPSKSTGPKTGLTISFRYMDVNQAGLATASSKLLQTTADGTFSSRSDANAFYTSGSMQAPANSGARFVRVVLSNDPVDGSTAASIQLRKPQAIVGPTTATLNQATGLYARTDLYCPPCWDAQVVFDQDDKLTSGALTVTGRTGDSLYAVVAPMDVPQANGSPGTIIRLDAQGTGSATWTMTANTNAYDTVAAKNGAGGALASTPALSFGGTTGHVMSSHVVGYISGGTSLKNHLDGTRNPTDTVQVADSSTTHSVRLGDNTGTSGPWSCMGLARFGSQTSLLDANTLVDYFATRAGVLANMANMV